MRCGVSLQYLGLLDVNATNSLTSTKDYDTIVYIKRKREIMIKLERNENIHRIEIMGFNSIPVGSDKPHDTIYFNVAGDSIYYAERISKTKQFKRKLKIIDGKTTFRYGGYVYDATDLI